MCAATPPREGTIADALVLVLSAGVSLRNWEDAGILGREAALSRRLGSRYGRLIVVSEGGAGDAALVGRLGGPDASTPGLVCNEQGQERTAFLAGLPGRVRAELGGIRSVVVKTNQMDAGDGAVAIARGLREAGLRVGLVARGGYPWSRFVAWEAGAESARAAEVAAAESELCRAADMVIGTTDRMLDDLRWRYGLSADRTALVPNYVPDEAHSDSGVRREAGTILFAGRLVPQKRVDLLIEAAALLAGLGAGRARLTIVGAGELEQPLRGLAGARGVEVDFVPRLPHTQLLDRMRRCAVYAQASSYEGHPKTVLEAMACGAAVVVADAPGLADVVETGSTGLVARATPASLARAIARVLRDADLAATLGREGAAGAEALRLDRVAALEAGVHSRAIARAGEGAAGSPGVVRWGPELLEADADAAAAAWARSLHGYSRRLPPDRRARFCASVETPIYHVVDRGAIETAGGVHPKHELMKYHDFFVERVRPGDRVLDLGCGYAEVARSIAQRTGAHVTGMEWSEANLAQARAMVERQGLADRVRIVQGDITRDRPGAPPGADGSDHFDVVVLSNVLEHLRTGRSCWRSTSGGTGRGRS
ncbi:MAG: glycosyltransferase [Phycisphaerales bacterium]|nr:glycosyltransferase [Phycisphaerales bacterium]